MNSELQNYLKIRNINETLKKQKCKGVKTFRKTKTKQLNSKIKAERTKEDNNKRSNASQMQGNVILAISAPVSINRFLIQIPYQQIKQQLGESIDFIAADTERGIGRTFMADKTGGQ
jgi:hypothetical protein